MTATKYLARDLKIEVNTGVTEALAAAVNLTTPFGVASTDTFTATAHGYVAGDRVRIATLTGGTGLVVLRDYWVAAGTTANTFQLLASPHGTSPVDFTTNVSAGSFQKVTTPAWHTIFGLRSLTHSPATERADTSGFDSEGRAEHLAAQRGESWSLEGFALEDLVTKARDPGQAAVEASGRLVGPAAALSYRITSPGGNTITFLATAEVTLAGGGHNDAAAWNAELEVTGKPVYA